MDEALPAAVEPSAPPPPSAPDHASEMQEIRETLSRIERGGEVEIAALQDADSGRQKPRYAGAADAARYLARKRRDEAEQAGVQTPQLTPEPDITIRDNLNRESIDPRQAAAELNSWRQRVAEEILKGVDPATAANIASGAQPEQQEAAPQPEAQPIEEPPASYSSGQLQEAQLQAQVAAQTQYSEHLADVLAAFQHQPMPAEFNTLKTPDDWIRLQQQNPQLAQHLQDYVQRRVATTQQLSAELNQLQEQRRQMYSEQHRAYGEAEDRAFEESVGGNVTPEMQQAAINTMQKVGYSAAELRAGWAGTPFLLRDRRAQMLIHKAALYDQSQAKAREAIRKPVPPVQRPGAGQPRTSAAQMNVEALSRKLDQTGSAQAQLRLGAQLVAERRRARQ
jgi:hypothetical protein